MTAATVNGITIEHDVHGPDDGPPLLLVMGLGGQLIGWPLEFVERVADRGFRVIRFDNRDIGLSTKIDAPVPTRRQVILAAISRRFAKSTYLLADMADDAAGLLDHLRIESAHVVGISMGGMIAQTLAIRHPRRVRSLTSIMSNTGDRKNGKVHRSVLRKLPRLMTRNPDAAITNGVEGFRLISGPHFDAAAVREMVQEAFLRSYDAEGTARQTMAIAASPDRTVALGRVTAPTLVVHGLLDPLVMPSGGIATAKAVPGARLLMYPDMAHDLPRSRWDEMIDEIVENTRRANPPGDAGDRASVA
jgi:pimeloyl-ACP methyl ester carboxylesterase